MTEKIKKIIYIAISIAILAISSNIFVPFAVPFTMQIFAIYLINYLLKPKLTFVVLILYIVIGLIGVPVFSGLGSGPATIQKPNGGFIFGFLLIPVTYIIFDRFNKSIITESLIALLSLCLVYTLAILHYGFINYMNFSNVAAFMLTILPYFFIDMVKIVAAFYTNFLLQKTKKYEELFGFLAVK